MKNKTFELNRLALVYFAILMAIFIVPVVAQDPYSEFNQSVDIKSIEQALGNESLDICAQKEINWSVAPGFVSGKIYELDINCSTFDPNKSGAKVWLIKFSNVEARDYALRNFETSRRHIGLGIAWSKGPLIILVDGNQKQEVINVIRKAVASIGMR